MVSETKYETRGRACERGQKGNDGENKAPFSFENFWLLATVALLFLFGKNCLIMDYLGLKDSSHDFSANCVVSFFSSTFSRPCMCRKIRCDGES